MDWAAVEAKKMTPPVKPNVKANDDYKNFDRIFLEEEVTDTPMEGMEKNDGNTPYQGFTYVIPGADAKEDKRINNDLKEKI